MPLVAVVEHRAHRELPDSLACGPLGQHVPVVSGRATQLAQDAERAAAREHERGQADQPAAVADGHDERCRALRPMRPPRPGPLRR